MKNTPGLLLVVGLLVAAMATAFVTLSAVVMPVAVVSEWVPGTRRYRAASPRSRRSPGM